MRFPLKISCMIQDVCSDLTQMLISSNISIMDGSYQLSSVLADKEIIQMWHGAGLPEDPVSLDNAAAMLYCKRWPLVMDPHGE